MPVDREKLRKNRQQSTVPTSTTLLTKKHSSQTNKRKLPCRATQCRMACFVNRVCLDISVNEAHFETSWFYQNGLAGFVLHAYHDHALSGGHFAVKPTYDKIHKEHL